ncbi:Kelch motif [Seminavis robusta]|uniref:Kelch motif n=1 Tax=Seminavis robusta TaxID=568900 RepID=A0A9N8EBC8_9STRA|nr:Kelch motif [Seminavis robusta]|eukprot:Sro836_g209080.1 Kelch motif (408) ;mRNA; f:41236-42459
METPTSLTLEDVLAFDWFLAVAGSFLSFADLQHLSSTSKKCRGGVFAGINAWPRNGKDLFWTCQRVKPPKVLVMGVHCRAQSPASSILQFSFGKLAFDTSKAQVVEAWSELYRLPAPLEPPTAPKLCAADESGSKIFLCGGGFFGCEAALLDVQSRSWTTLPNMPSHKPNAGSCRLGSRIYIVGGQIDYANHGALRIDQTVHCFDLVAQEWVDSGIPAFPGRAYMQSAVIARDDHTIVVAGGRMLSQTQLFMPCREVYSLDVESGVWTRLVDLPESDDAAEKISCHGFLWKRASTESTTCVVARGSQTVQLLPNGQWEALPSFRQEKSDSCVACIGDALVSFSSNGHELVHLETGLQCDLSPQHDENDDIVMADGMKLVDTKEQPFFARLECLNKIVPVYSKNQGNV